MEPQLKRPAKAKYVRDAAEKEPEEYKLNPSPVLGSGAAGSAPSRAAIRLMGRGGVGL